MSEVMSQILVEYGTQSFRIPRLIFTGVVSAKYGFDFRLQVRWTHPNAEKEQRVENLKHLLESSMTVSSLNLV